MCREVYSVGRKCDKEKADVILPILAALPGTLGVFVDDQPSEHTDSRLVQCKQLHRVLFTRTG